MVKKIKLIKVSEENWKWLKSKKIHPRQPFDDVITTLKGIKDNDEGK